MEQPSPHAAEKSGEDSSIPASEKKSAERVRKFFSGSLSVVVVGLVAVLTIGSALVAMGAAGFLPLSGFEDRIIRSVEERMGPGWKIGITSAVLTRVDGRSAVRIGDVFIQHKGGLNMRAPEALLSYDPWGLLFGQVRITGIDLRGVNARLGIDAEGSLIFDAGSEPVKLGTGLPKAEAVSDSGAFVLALLSAVDLMAREDGELFALETARLTGAKLSLVDANGRERIGFNDVNVRMAPIDSAARRIEISAKGPTGLKDFSIELRAGDNNRRMASVDIRQFEPSDIFALVLGDKWGGLDGFSLSGKASVETAGPNTPFLAKLDLDVSSGTAQVFGMADEAVRIDGGKIRLTFENARERAEIEELTIKSGATNVTLAGQVNRASDLGWAVQMKGKGTIAGEGRDPAVALDDIQISLNGQANGDLSLERIELRGPDTSATLKGVIRSFASAPAVEMSLGITDTLARKAVAIWPVFVSPEARKVVSERVTAGFVERLDLAMNFPADVVKAAQQKLAVPDDSIKVTVKGRDVTFIVVDNLVPLTDGVITALVTGRTLNVEASSARVEPEKGRVLTLSDGTFTIPDTHAPRQTGRASFRATGNVDALASFLASPALREFAPLLTDANSVKGSFDLRSNLTLPLADDVKPSEVIVTSSGTLANISSDTLIGKERLDGANLRANYERGTLTLKGEGRVSGLQSLIEVRVDPKGVGEAALTTVTDQATRQKRGLNVPGLTGPVSVRLVKALGPKANNTLRVEADLTKAAIDGVVPGWSKPAGKAGKVSFQLNADREGSDLEDFQLDSAPVLLRGKVNLGKDMGFESASFTSARLSPGDDIRLDFALDGGVAKVMVRGKVFDARPFMKSEGKDSKNDPDVDLDLSVPIVTGFNSEAIGNAVVKLSRRQGEFRSLSVDGRIGKAPLSARLQRGQGGAGSAMVVEADDGGSALRFSDLYRRAYGGNLVAVVPQGNSRGQGSIFFRDFEVRNEPALRRVLGGGQTGGIGGDRDVVATRNAGTGTEVAFTKLKVDFTRAGSRLDIQDAVIWGPLVGFTAQGSVDFARDRIDIGGTFVPSFAFNNAFAKVPIFGLLLGGGQNEGLFAVNFRLGGSAAQPTMSINPLSAIAPGILRRFVDPGGGTPVGDAPSLPRGAIP